MTKREENLSKLLDEHQHESGLHMIGGRKRLLERLLAFIEAECKTAERENAAA
jgi:hypothetical protein